MSKVTYQNPNFDKKLYWERRKKGLRGQVDVPPTGGPTKAAALTQEAENA